MDEPTKRCAKCEIEQPLEAFSRASNNADGLRGECKVCNIAYKASYRRVLRASGLCELSCGKKAIRGRARCFEHLLADIVSQAINCEKNIASGRRRGEGAGPGSRVGKSRDGSKAANRMAVAKRLWARSGGVCIYTGELLIPGVNGSLDHIIPVSRGGTSAESNLQFISARANRSKSDMTHDEFVAHCRAIAGVHRGLAVADEYVELRRLIARRMDALGADLEYHAFISVA